MLNNKAFKEKIEQHNFYFFKTNDMKYIISFHNKYIVLDILYLFKYLHP